MRPPPLSDASHEVVWAYGAYALSRGEAGVARGYLEAVASGAPNDIINPALLFRDLSEARLFSGDLVGAGVAAQEARVRLADEPRTAQFQADDRRLFERVIDSLEAAADDDVPRLTELAADDSSPSADACYLLGWLLERHGEAEAAQTAYRAYLARAPRWSFLRATAVLRQRAEDRSR